MRQSNASAIVTKMPTKAGEYRYQKGTPPPPPLRYFQTVENFVAVGIPVARHPPHRSVRALVSAYGSYLG